MALDILVTGNLVRNQSSHPESHYARNVQKDGQRWKHSPAPSYQQTTLAEPEILCFPSQ